MIVINKLSVEELKALVSQIEKMYDEIEKNWESIINEDILSICDAWSGNDCDSYANKLKSFDVEMEKALKTKIDIINSINNEIEIKNNQINNGGNNE